VSLLDGLKNAGYVVDESLKSTYESHIAKEQARIDAAIDPNDMFAAFSPKPLPTEYQPSRKQLADMVKNNDVALITIGRTSGEFLDRYIADFTLSEAENSLIKTVCEAFHAAGKKVAVVLNIGGAIETATWKGMPDAILCAWQAGQEGGNSVADVLKGNASPSGKLPMTFPVNFADHASSANFPIDEVANTNIINNTKTSFDRKNVDYTVYEEGIYVGYRWFDTQAIEVSYPFGYGLSYTTFEYSEPAIKAGKNETTVSVSVKNTGAYAGKEVVQLYVSAPKGALDKPVHELKAFAKTAELQPGESQVLTFVVNNEDLASFDEAQSAWVVDAGTYNFHIAASSRDIKATLAADVKGSVKKANDVLNLKK
jgi:beta-glucosidase